MPPPPPRSAAKGPAIRLILSLICVVAAGITAYTAASRPSSPAAPSPAAPPAPKDPYAPLVPPGEPDIEFASAPFTIKNKPFTLEIADTDAKSERGLMYRNAMQPDHGMLFVFPAPSTAGFWMRNTWIPLDIVFLDKDGKVVTIHHAKPRDDTNLPPTSPAQFVIELNAGTADKIGLRVGDTVDVKKSLKTASPPSDK